MDMRKRDEFIKLSRYAGMREDLVQAGGGNSSVKISSNEMLIKASGVLLSDISQESGYSFVNPNVITKHFADAQQTRWNEDTGKHLLEEAYLKGSRPSIETFLHAITNAFTLHTHPAVVNILTSREGGMEELASLFPDALLVPYATPGMELAQKYYAAYSASGRRDAMVNLVFLENHGMVISAASADEVIYHTEHVLQLLERYLKIDMAAYHMATHIYQELSGCITGGLEKVVVLSNDRDIRQAVRLFGASEWPFQFCPDCIVYCGKHFLNLPEDFTANEIMDYIRQFGCPAVIRCKDQIYIVADTMKKAKETESVLRFSAQVALHNQAYKMRLLSEEERDFLTSWEAEKYRKQLNRKE